MRLRAHRCRIALLPWLIAWSVSGHLASVCAQESSPSFTLHPTGAVVNAGLGIELVAEVSGDPTPALQWQFNGDDLMGQTASVLNLGFLATNQSGLYRLRASNSVGVAFSDDAMVTVLPVYPEILSQPDSATAVEGDAVSLVVQMRYTPGVEVYYQWYRDGVELIDQFPVQVGSRHYRLQLPYVGLTNAGNYQFVATNAYGSVTSEVATVTVIAALTNAGWVDKSFDTGFGFNEPVKALAIQADGRVLVGGIFTSFNEQGVSRIVRLNLDGSLDGSFCVTNVINGEVLAIALQPDGKILVGGRFNSIGGFAQNHLARLNADGSVDPSFVMNPPLVVPLVGGETVSSIFVQADGRILHAGTSYWLGRRQPDGSVDPTFQPFIQQFSGGARNDPIPARCLALDRDGKLLLGVLGLRRFHVNGAPDTSFNSPRISANAGFPLPDIYATAAFPDGRILIGGSFSQIMDMPRRALACLNPDGSVSPTFAGVLTNSCALVNTIALLPDGKVMIAGCLNAISGVPTRAGIARLNADGSLDTSFDTSRAIDGTSLTSLATRDTGEVLAGGSFSRFGGFLRGNFVQLHGDASQTPAVMTQPVGQTVEEGRKTSLFVEATSIPAADFQWRFNGTPITAGTNQVLQLADIRLEDAGDYSVVLSNAFGSVTSEVARVTVTPQVLSAGSTDIEFFIGEGVDGRVFCSAALPDGKTLIGGVFGAVHGVPRQHVARLNVDGSLDETFDAGRIQLGLSSGSFDSGQGVFAVATDGDGRVYLGGSFTNIDGMARHGVARLTSDGTLDETFDTSAGANNVVFSVIPLASGRVLVGGAFLSVAGIQRPLLARLEGNGTLDTSFAPSFGGSGGSQIAIYALTLQPDGKVVAVGSFASGSAQNLARFNISGSRDGTFASGIAGITARSMIVDPHTSRIYIGATRNLPPGERVGLITCLNSNGLPVAGFDASGRWFGRIRALGLDGAGRLLVVSGNTNTSGTWTSYVLRLSPEGNVETNFTTALDGDVHSILSRPADDTMLVAGEFSFANGARRRSIARLRGDTVVTPIITNQPVSQSVATGQPVTFQVGTTRPLGDVVQWYFNGVALVGATSETLSSGNPLTTHSGEYYAVVSNLSGVVTSTVVTLTVAPPELTPGGVDFEFASGAGFGPDAPVYALALQPDGRLLIGGAFSNVQGVLRQRIARLHPDGSLDLSFDTSALGTFTSAYSPAIVRALAIQPDGKVIVGGFFEFRRSSSRYYVGLTRLNSENGSVDESFLPGFSGDPEVRSLLVEPDGQVLVGRVNASGILRLQATNGMREMSFQGNLDHAALALGRTSDGRIYAGGKFTHANGAERSRIVRLLPTGQLDSSFQPGVGADSDVNSLVVQPDGRVVIGGLFSSVGGEPRIRVARLNTDGSLDESFDPGDGPNAAVHAVALERDGSILIAGDFTVVGSTSRARIARLKPDGSLDASFDPGSGANGTVFVLAPGPEGGAYASGSFTAFNGAARARVTRLHTGVILSQPQLGDNGFTVTINTATGRTYWLEATGDLANDMWTPVASVAGNGSAQTLVAAPAASPAFYRVRAE